MLYLINGENQYASIQRVKALRTAFGQDYVIVDGETITEAAEVFRHIDTYSMFAKKQLVIVKRLASNSKKTTLEQAIVEKFLRMQQDEQFDIKSLDLIFWEGKPKARKTAKKTVKKTVKPKKSSLTLNKFLEENAVVETYAYLSDNELIKWLNSIFANSQIKVTSQQLISIISRVGTDQFLLESEVSKIIFLALSENRHELKSTDFDLLTIYEQPNMIWDLTDAICQKNKPYALKLIEKMLHTPQDAPMLIGAILKQFKNIYLYKRWGQKGEKLAKLLKLTPYTTTKLAKTSAGFTEEQVRTVYSKLVNLDYSVKQGRIEVKLGLDMLVATL